LSVSLNLAHEQLREQQQKQYEKRLCYADLKVIASEQGLFSFLPRYLDLSTLCFDKVKNYSQFRRYVKSISRLNYLQFANFDFDRSTFLTLTINDDFIDDEKSIRYALNRVECYFRRKGIVYYIIVKELGTKTNRLHYHAILFNVSYLLIKVLRRFWRIGNIKIQEAKNSRGGVYYLVSYIKKGLNCQWSRGFFKNEILSNDVFYLVKYDKSTKQVYIDNIFNSPYVSKKDYKIFKGRLNKSEMALLINRNEKLDLRRCKGVP
jgi:hypothetical protein